MEPLSIAHVDAERGFSGGEVQVFLLMEGLRARGHRCVLLAPPGSAALARARELGLETREVRMRGDLDLRAVGRLARELRDARCELAHLHTGRASWLGGLAAWRLGLPAVTTRRMDRPVARGLKTRLVHERFAARTAAISPAVERRLLEGGVPRERVVLVPSSVDPARLAPGVPRAEARRLEGAAEDDVVVLALAGLVRRKGLDLLLDAFAAAASERPRARLWIAGEGPERAALQRQLLHLGLGGRARLLGARADKAELLGACDLFALPSRAEGLGVAALEAMAAGRPVLAARVGGLGEAVVDDGTGLLVPPEDVEALAAGLARLLDDADLRARLGAAGPARVDAGFHVDAMVDAYERIYAEVLAERRVGAGA